ncbi:hypothetical protein JT487_000688 [Salmonella enterica]|nr:hypothetical protein [Salmonella enterica]
MKIFRNTALMELYRYASNNGYQVYFHHNKGFVTCYYPGGHVSLFENSSFDVVISLHDYSSGLAYGTEIDADQFRCIFSRRTRGMVRRPYENQR